MKLDADASEGMISVFKTDRPLHLNVCKLELWFEISGMVKKRVYLKHLNLSVYEYFDTDADLPLLQTENIFIFVLLK